MAVDNLQIDLTDPLIEVALLGILILAFLGHWFWQNRYKKFKDDIETEMWATQDEVDGVKDFVGMKTGTFFRKLREKRLRKQLEEEIRKNQQL